MESRNKRVTQQQVKLPLAVVSLYFYSQGYYRTAGIKQFLEAGQPPETSVWPVDLHFGGRDVLICILEAVMSYPEMLLCLGACENGT